MASTQGIFETYAMNTELAELWNKRKAALETERLQPYADLLLDNIVWPSILSRKDAIFADLKAKCSEARAAHQLSVPIWSFSHVFDYPRHGYEVGGPPHEYALERGDKDALKRQQIYELGLRQWLSVEDPYQMDVLAPATAWQIIKKTDFCEQLAIRFGCLYTVSVKTGESEEHTDPSGEQYFSQRVSLYLNVFPNGLPLPLEAKLVAFNQKLALRERRVLKAGEKLIYWVGEGADMNVYGPPLPPPPPHTQVRLFGTRPCHCCHDDSEEE